MTIKKELYELFESGKTPLECLNLGYKKATVYKEHNNWKKDKQDREIKVLIDESEFYKAFYGYMNEGRSLVDIAGLIGVSPSKVIDAYEGWRKLLETDARLVEDRERHEEIKKEIDYLVTQKSDLTSEIDNLRKEKANYYRRIVESVRDLKILKKFGRVATIVGIKERIRGLEYEIRALEIEKVFEEPSDLVDSILKGDEYKKRKAEIGEKIMVKEGEIEDLEVFLKDLGIE